MNDAFADAQAWYDRAQWHIGEYSHIIDRVWDVHRSSLPDGTFRYALRIDRDSLTRARPVAGEVANALFQALDNIVGVAARANGVVRTNGVSWPWVLEPDPDANREHAVRPKLSDKLKELEKKGMPDDWLKLIEATFSIPATPLAQIDIVKEVSNSGKHWELVPTKANAVGMMWIPPEASQPVPLDIPADHFLGNDEFVFHEGAAIDVSAVMSLIDFQLVAATKNLRVEPIFAFYETARFVATALEKARLLWNEAAGS
ncbi:MAG: hypothetical protein KYX64_05990 [Sphingopyxis sp.]|nr:hypothetical protein [Sphingopyxis sp.]